MTDDEFNDIFARVMAAGPNRDTLLLIGEFHRRLGNATRQVNRWPDGQPMLPGDPLGAL